MNIKVGECILFVARNLQFLKVWLSAALSLWVYNVDITDIQAVTISIAKTQKVENITLYIPFLI